MGHLRYCRMGRATDVASGSRNQGTQEARVGSMGQDTGEHFLASYVLLIGFSFSSSKGRRWASIFDDPLCARLRSPELVAALPGLLAVKVDVTFTLAVVRSHSEKKVSGSW